MNPIQCVHSQDGPIALRYFIDTAEPYPIMGLYDVRDYWSEVWSKYHRMDGSELGVTTGWSGLDDFYRVVPGKRREYIALECRYSIKRKLK